MLIPIKKIVAQAEANWYMVINGNTHDLFFENDHDKLIQKYGNIIPTKCVGRCAKWQYANEIIITI